MVLKRGDDNELLEALAKALIRLNPEDREKIMQKLKKFRDGKEPDGRDGAGPGKEKRG